MAKLIILFGLIVVLSLAVGCAGPSRLETDYGTSFKLSKFNQILNPEAEKDLEPVTGFDGKAANHLVDKYERDFDKPPPPPAFIFGMQGEGNSK